ncbi:hypothetical protein RUM43_002185 [Polyplax serrata]|uniref:Uncharacterized protein n=1 Tax=Polyplax serrata TaxID=468196 RepID=A0AAN8RVR2_POLSC
MSIGLGLRFGNIVLAVKCAWKMIDRSEFSFRPKSKKSVRRFALVPDGLLSGTRPLPSPRFRHAPARKPTNTQGTHILIIMGKNRLTKWPWTLLLGLVVVALVLGVGLVEAKKSVGSPAAQAPAGAPAKEEPVIEEVSAKQLEKILNEKDYVAVFWCKFFQSS